MIRHSRQDLCSVRQLSDFRDTRSTHEGKRRVCDCKQGCGNQRGFRTNQQQLPLRSDTFFLDRCDDDDTEDEGTERIECHISFLETVKEGIRLICLQRILKTSDWMQDGNDNQQTDERDFNRCQYLPDDIDDLCWV